jgi:hypothetical protein
MYVNTMDIVFTDANDIKEYKRICTERDYVCEKRQKAVEQYVKDHMHIHYDSLLNEVSIDCADIKI